MQQVYWVVLGLLEIQVLQVGLGRLASQELPVQLDYKETRVQLVQ